MGLCPGAYPRKPLPFKKPLAPCEINVDSNLAAVQAGHSGDKARYGRNVTHAEILHGKVAVAEPARRPVEELGSYPNRENTTR
jgi:hypothetical protein